MKKIQPSASAIRNEQDIDLIRAALFNGDGLAGTDGPVKEYEVALRDYFGVKCATAVSSGTAAIHSALHTLGITEGDEVIVPAIAAVMTALPILELGAKPIFVDCEPEAFTLNIDCLVDAVTSKTKAVMSVPMWGYPSTSQAMIDFCKSADLPLIVDAAQGIGTISENVLEGTQGRFGCFSTHEIKMISTGEGGFVLSNDADLDSDLRAFTRLGNRPGPLKTFGQQFGLNLKFNSLSAGLGISQVKKLPQTLEARAENANLWRETLSRQGSFTSFMPATEKNIPSSYSAIFLLDPKLAQKTSSIDLAARLAQKNFKTDVHKYGLKLMPEYEVFNPFYNEETNGSIEACFPNAADIMNRMLILPTHYQIDEETIADGSKRIINSLEELAPAI